MLKYFRKKVTFKKRICLEFRKENIDHNIRCCGFMLKYVWIRVVVISVSTLPTQSTICQEKENLGCRFCKYDIGTRENPHNLTKGKTKKLEEYFG